MADYEMLFPGRFLKKSDLPRPTTIRIVDVAPADLATDESTAAVKKGAKVKKERAQGLVTFKARPGDTGEYKGNEWILCKTNGALIAAALGERDFTKWAGRLITIHNDPRVGFGGQIVGGIRVYGSPEMTEEKRVEVKMPKRHDPEVYFLKPTGTAKGKSAATGETPTGTEQPEQPAEGDPTREPGAEG